MSGHKFFREYPYREAFLLEQARQFRAELSMPLILLGGITNRQTIDRIIAKYAPEWPVEQLAIIDRNVLRLAIFELGSRDADTPAKVVINEAVELAKRFGSDNSPRFINGVLGSALDEIQRKLF